MATKRFDDIDKKARELEAQAKRLRRKRQAERVDACGKALLKFFPELKKCDSSDEVFKFVSELKTKIDFADKTFDEITFFTLMHSSHVNEDGGTENGE